MVNKHHTQGWDSDWPAGSLPLRMKPTGIEGSYATDTSYYDEFGSCVEIGGKEPLGTTALRSTAALELCIGSRANT